MDTFANFALGVLVIVLDGLRPDYVTPEAMPNLHRMAQQGVWFEDHHSVFPTVTRVNSPSIATGSYPKTHGLMGNTVYHPEVDAERGMSTSDVDNLIAIAVANDGRLLTTKSLGEIVEEAGGRLLAASSGSSGSSFLLNHKVTGGGVINTGRIHPESSRDAVIDVLGPVPPDEAPNDKRNGWVVDAFLHALENKKNRPDVTLMWLSDPDHTAHDYGIGAKETMEALRLVDAQIGRILAKVKAFELEDMLNIVVTTDHGFTTNTGGASVQSVLKELSLEDAAVVVGGAIYFRDKDQNRIRTVVRVLQAEPSFGAIFTKADEPGSMQGWVPGTFSFDAVHWNHDRSADILVSRNWTDEENEHGYKGTVTSPGVAGHGSLSPYDVHGTLIAYGRSFKKGFRSSLPTSNVDIAPTVLELLYLDRELSISMDGRVLVEAFSKTDDAYSPRVETETLTVSDGGYEASLQTKIFDGRRYVDFAAVTR